MSEVSSAEAQSVNALAVPTDLMSFQLSSMIVTHSDPRGAAAESIYALRTHLMSRHLQGGRRSLVICETAQAGGLFVAANLAASFAEAGVRTLLIDADLRRGRLAEQIIPSRRVIGLAEIIDDPELPIGSAIQQVLRNLSVIYAGNAGDRAQELLATQRFDQICDLCMRDFDLTIAISPPANYYSDARRIASLLRYALVVARRDVTFVKDVRTLLTELASDGAFVLGTVYNDF